MLRIENVNDDGPADAPEVAQVIRRLDADLCRVLGSDTVFCVVVADVRRDCTHLQAMTNSSESEAREMLRVALAREFGDRVRQ